MRVVLACCALSWVMASANVVFAVLRGDWLDVALAANAALCAAGWLMSAREWARWRALALAAAHLMGWPGTDTPGDTPSP